MNQINHKHISKKFSSLEQKQIVRLSNDFNDLFFKVSIHPELLDSTLMVFKLVLKIIHDLRLETFNKSDAKINSIQLSLFESNFKTENNSYASFSYKITDLDKNRNYKAIEDALIFLTEYMNGTHICINSRTGKEFKFIGGFISNPEYTKGRVSFLISAYFIEKIVTSDMYNDVLISCVEKLREPKYILFYFWLLKIPAQGTVVNVHTLITSFNLSYSNYDDLYKNFLYPLRKKLNTISNVSFNFKKLPENKIGISKQYLTPNIEVSENTFSSLDIRRKTHYFKLRHKLEDKDLLFMKEALKSKENMLYISNIYKVFIKECRAAKINATSITGINFIQRLQNIIIQSNDNDIKLI